MKRDVYKRFKNEIVNSQTGNEPIYYMGYHWIDLTRKQGEEIYNILRGKDFVNDWNNGLKDFFRWGIQINTTGFILFSPDCIREVESKRGE